MSSIRRSLALLTAALMLLIPLSAFCESDEADNLIFNPQVDSLFGWDEDCWDTGSATVFELSEEGYDDNSSLYIENRSANDSRFVQTVDVQPDTVYRISCRVKAEGCGGEGYGANLSVKNTYVYSNIVNDTNGEWEVLELYGETGPDQYDLELCARIGGYSAINTGKAWFDNFEMTAVTDVPDDVTVQSLVSMNSGKKDAAADDDGEPVDPERNTEALTLIACLFAAFAFAGVSTMRRMNETDLAKRGKGETPIFIIMMAFALVFRFYLAVRYPGYRVDLNCFKAWSSRMLDLGPLNFYDPENYFCDYPPVYILLLTVCEAFRRLASIAYSSTLHLALLKLMPIAFDIAGACLIYRVGRKRIGAQSAAALGILHAFNIAGMVISAAWGQADSVLTLFISLTLLMAIEKRWTPALILYVLAVLTKPQAVLFAPIGIAFYVKDVITDKENRLKHLRACLIALVCAYLVLLPFSITKYEGFLGKLTSPVQFLYTLFVGTTGGYAYVTVNALNLYDALKLNWAHAGLHPTLMTVAWILLAASVLYGCVLVFVSKQRRNVLLISATVIALIFAFGPMMHERYLYPCILLLALFYAMGRDRRVLGSMIICSAALFMNAALVLQGGMGEGNFGHLHDSEQLINTIVSLVNVINALFLAYTSFRVCVQDRLSPFADGEPDREHPAAVRLGNTKDARLRLGVKEIIAVALITVIYSAVAFTNLGSLSAPQTEWVSSDAGESVVFDLGETKLFRMMYYGGICNTGFKVQLSDDGETWSEAFNAEYNQGVIFRWLYYVPGEDNNGSFTNVYSGSETVSGAPETHFASDSCALTETDAWNAFPYVDSYPAQQARYVRITTVSERLRLREVAFADAAGKVLPVTITDAVCADDASKLADEQDTMPVEPSYMNGTYFDEIYHARTGYEFTQSMVAYEWTHPPLGKVLIMAGINLFGMTPFGWRFMGTLFGVLMLPLMYLLAKQLTHRADLSFIAMCLMALDSMHFTQSRLATVDSYAVFFIMLMYLFMFRYQQMNWNRGGLRRTLIPLALCGISMGLGIATKWIGIYAAIGLAVILFMTFWKRFSEYRWAVRSTGRENLFDRDQSGAIVLLLGFVAVCLAALIAGLRYAAPLLEMEISLLEKPFITGLCIAAAAGGIIVMAAGAVLMATAPKKAEHVPEYSDFWKDLTFTIMWCVLFFVLIPLIIYYFSHYWQLRGEANGLNIDRVIRLQGQMYRYHAGLGGDTHYFRSPWYEWPIIWKPMWYYSGTKYQAEGVISSISCMGNPAVWWTGLISLICTVLCLAFRKHRSDAYHLVIIGFLSQFLPWVLVPRSTFIYHYFASVPFIILCTVLMLDRVRKVSKRTFIVSSAILLVSALLLFVAFYPIESGMPVARSYAMYLRWFKWYNFEPY